MFKKNKEWANIFITKLQEYLYQANLGLQSVISTYAFESLLETKISGSKSKGFKDSSKKSSVRKFMNQKQK